MIRILHPELVHSYDIFDEDNTFDPIKVSGALQITEEFSQEVTGAFTAVIRYKTPYMDHKGNRFLISFALEDTVICNTTLGLSTIDGIYIIWNVKNSIMRAEWLQ
jgi:hypothetical protein